jgi:thiol-disulfide isomerase/thioredoxin
MKFRIICGVILFAMTFSAQAATRGISGQSAPAWKVEEWFNLASDATSLDIDNFEGKIVYLYCFQSWCPGCHASGFPTLREVHDAFKEDEEVAFVAVQTVFEGYHANTLERAKQIAKEYQLTMPIGHSGSRAERPGLMSAYRTGGTPWTIVIDRDGIVRFNDYHLKPHQAIGLINSLKKTPESKGVKPSD